MKFKMKFLSFSPIFYFCLCGSKDALRIFRLKAVRGRLDNQKAVKRHGEQNQSVTIVMELIFHNMKVDALQATLTC